jgi:hypothetical protein
MYYYIYLIVIHNMFEHLHFRYLQFRSEINIYLKHFNLKSSKKKFKNFKIMEFKNPWINQLLYCYFVGVKFHIYNNGGHSVVEICSCVS